MYSWTNMIFCYAHTPVREAPLPVLSFFGRPVSFLCKNIRILHMCEVRIEKSVPRVTVWHHEALPSDAKQWSRGTEFFIRTEHSCLIFFLAYFRFRMFYFKSSIHYHIQWRWRGKMTSLWRQNDVNLTTKLRDVLYNQYKPNSREKILFWVR